MHCELDQPKQQQQQVYKRKQQQPKKGTQSQAKSYNLLFPVNTTLCAHCLLMKYHSNKNKHAHTHRVCIIFVNVVRLCLFVCLTVVCSMCNFNFANCFVKMRLVKALLLIVFLSDVVQHTHTQTQTHNVHCAASLEFKNSNIYFFAHHLMTE